MTEWRGNRNVTVSCTGGLLSPGNQRRVEFTGQIPSDWLRWPSDLVLVRMSSIATVPGRRSPFEMVTSIALQHDNSISAPRFWRASIAIGVKSVVLNDIEAGSPRDSTASGGKVRSEALKNQYAP